MPDNVLARRFVLMLHAIFFSVHRDPVNTLTYGKRTPALPAWITVTTGGTFLDLAVKWVLGFYNGFLTTSEVTSESGVMWDASNGRVLTFKDQIFNDPKVMYLTLRRLAGGKHGARETYLRKSRVFPHVFFGHKSLYALVEDDGYLTVDMTSSIDMDFKLAVLSPELVFPTFPAELCEQRPSLLQAHARIIPESESGMSKVSKHAGYEQMVTCTKSTDDDSASKRLSKNRRMRKKIPLANIYTRYQLMMHERWQFAQKKRLRKEMERVAKQKNDSRITKASSAYKKGGSRSA